MAAIMKDAASQSTKLEAGDGCFKIQDPKSMYENSLCETKHKTDSFFFFWGGGHKFVHPISVVWDLGKTFQTLQGL